MTIITLNLTSFSIHRYNCLLVTKDETPTKLLSLRIMNPLIEYTVPHNGSINACSGEILTLQTYRIMHQSFETLGHPLTPPPRPCPIRLGDERGNPGPLASYLLHFCYPVSGGCAI